MEAKRNIYLRRWPHYKVCAKNSHNKINDICFNQLFAFSFGSATKAATAAMAMVISNRVERPVAATELLLLLFFGETNERTNERNKLM